MLLPVFRALLCYRTGNAALLQRQGNEGLLLLVYEPNFQPTDTVLPLTLGGTYSLTALDEGPRPWSWT